MSSKSFMIVLAFALLAFGGAPSARAETPGITPTEIRVGTISPFSGPASALGNTGKGLIAFVKSLNDRGGVNGRKIDLIAYDDAYSPPNAMEQARRLVESDGIAFMFGQLGTPGNSATVGYLKTNGIPDGFIMTGADKFANHEAYPNTTTGLPNFDTEARVYAKFALETRPASKIAILYQNDDLGKAFVRAFTEVAGAEKLVAVSYEVADPTVDSQVVNLKASGAEVFVMAGTPKFAAQALRKVNDIGWRPLTFLNMVSSSVSATLVPAGLDKVQGVVSAAFFKDPKFDGGESRRHRPQFGHMRGCRGRYRSFNLCVPKT
jgi:branched-chain amino acid transport system substrate-binding protein